MRGFDPYHKWLGISPEEQPPNHYRLLGLNVFESDLDVIEAAADRQNGLSASCASGEHVEASQNLLDRVSTARVCLLNSDMKAAYDAKLPRLTRRLSSKQQVKRRNVYHLNVESVSRERVLKFWFRSLRSFNSSGEVSLTDPEGKTYVVRSWSPKDFPLDKRHSIVVDVTAGVKKPGLYKVVFQYKSGRDGVGVHRVQITTGRYPHRPAWRHLRFSGFSHRRIRGHHGFVTDNGVRRPTEPNCTIRGASKSIVIPAQAGDPVVIRLTSRSSWFPACAGMTLELTRCSGPFFGGAPGHWSGNCKHTFSLQPRSGYMLSPLRG